MNEVRGRSATIALTALAMIAFAGNSVLCRTALGGALIDAASFASVRVFSGAIMLVVLVGLRSPASLRAAPNWPMVAGLFCYMVFFAFAYTTLATGTGALILFGAVQLTMFAVALRSGERFGAISWFGLVIAVAGLVYLVSPGLAAPDPFGAGLMAMAGIAWGAYSLFGRGSKDPLADTARNFLLCVPLVIAVSLVFRDDMTATPRGLLLAALSGAITSGIGYAIWYQALKGLTAGRAATVQLSVPAIAAMGGVVLLAEDLTLRLVLASVATLGGVAVVLAQRVRAS
jgi:drug/metabolite transporter (DMT)-like permease